MTEEKERKVEKKGKEIPKEAQWNEWLWFDFMDICIWIHMVWYLVKCPYTKVEESFPTQSIHDILNVGNLTHFDHYEFPGPIPRTFIGQSFISVLTLGSMKCISLVQEWIVLYKEWLHADWFTPVQFSQKPIMQLILFRMLIAMCSTLCLSYFRSGIKQSYASKAKGQAISRMTAFFMLMQFHLGFYLSRPLPNIFAASLVFLGFGLYVRKQSFNCFMLLGFAATVFRSELFVLIAPLAIFSLLFNYANLFAGIFSAIWSITFGLVFSGIIDSLFWNRILVPEVEVFYFNTILNKSKNWGTSPFHWYFTSALPRAQGVALFWCVVGIAFCPSTIFKKSRLHILTLSSLTFVLCYSFLPHKELRFIMYICPVLNIQAAELVYTMITSFNSTLLRMFIRILFYMSLFASICLSSVFLAASELNYPGAKSMVVMKNYLASNSLTNQNIYMDAHVTMTGVTRFVQYGPDVYNNSFSKADYVEDYSIFDYIMTGDLDKYNETHQQLALIYKFGGLNISGMKYAIRQKNHTNFLNNMFKVVDGIHIMKKRPSIETKLKTTKSKEKEPKIEKDGPLAFEKDAQMEKFNNPSNVRPNLKWSQTAEKFSITMSIHRAQNVEYTFSSHGILFMADETKRGKSKTFSFELSLYDAIDGEASSIDIKKEKISIFLVKAKQGAFWPRLLEQKKAPAFLKISWEDWEDPPEIDDWGVEKDEDELEEEREAERLSNELKEREKKRLARLKAKKAKVHPTKAITNDFLYQLGFSISKREMVLSFMQRLVNENPQTIAMIATIILTAYVGFWLSIKTNK